MSFNPENIQNRVLIVDFNHMAHNFAYGGYRASVTKKVGTQIVTIDTTIPSGTLKNIMRWSNGGRTPTVVCFDRPCPSRKAYFMQERGMSHDKSYKGKREGMPSDMYEGIKMAQDLLEQAGVSCLYAHGWEADDLVYLAIQQAKKDYPNYYIDVVTNDADLLPLVDEQVSVFFRSKKFTFAEHSFLEKNKYLQVTPKNYQEVVEGLSAFKGLTVPYNTLLLYKILRGDSSDNLPSPFKKGTMTPRRLSTLVWQMKLGKLKEGYTFLFPKGSNVPNGVQTSKPKQVGYFDSEEDIEFVASAFEPDSKTNLEGLFVYTTPSREYYQLETQEILTEDQARSLGREGGARARLVDSPVLVRMLEVLEYYGFSQEELHLFKSQYVGMNLAQPYLNLPKELKRIPWRQEIAIKPFSGMLLNQKASTLNIHLDNLL